MNELWWLSRHPRRMLAVWWRGIEAKVHCDVALWFDVRAISPLAVLAGLNCIAGLMLFQERAGGTLPRLTNLRLCIAAGAAAFLIIASRWLLLRIERERPAFWIRSLLAAASILPLVTLLMTAAVQNALWAVGVVLILTVAAANANLLWSFCFESDREPLRLAPVPVHEASAIRFSEPIALEQLIHQKHTTAAGQPASKPALRIEQAPAPAVERAPVIGRQTADDWQERTIGELGRTVVRGKQTAVFAAGQSQTTIHIPFVPPFAVLPEFSCKVADAPGVRARTPAVYRYGARIELKRSAGLETELRVAVEFCALATIVGKRAA